ncbi:MAG TPA: hypothetical protein VFJ47_16730 [Terriglobales bacterium]|nr:hypothetical protein [Terriglobales bacterium]
MSTDGTNNMEENLIGEVRFLVADIRLDEETYQMSEGRPRTTPENTDPG